MKSSKRFLETISERTGCELRLTYVPGKKKWYASLKGLEIKRIGFLESASGGHRATPDEAREVLAKRLDGERLVTDATKESRREWTFIQSEHGDMWMTKFIAQAPQMQERIEALEEALRSVTECADHLDGVDERAANAIYQICTKALKDAEDKP